MAHSDSFRTARWIRTINLVLQAVLFLTFFAGLNYLARNHPSRFDLTQHRRFSLSTETLSYVQRLNRPLKIYVTLAEPDENPEIRGLLREYANASEGNPAGKIEVRYLDVYQNRREAELNGLDQPDLLVLTCGDRRRAVTLSELYRYTKTKDNKTERSSFQGEQALTAALLDVSSPEKKKVYFLAGHGELRPDETDGNRGLTVIRDQLRVRNFDVDGLDLGIARKIPADASVLIAVAPQSRFSPAEQELLREYLRTNAGRLLLFLAPGYNAGLEDLLLDWGILVDDDLVFDTDPKSISDTNDLVILAFDKTHPITQTMITFTFGLHLGPTRTVRPDPGRSLVNGLNTVTIAATSTTAWGEVSYNDRTRLPAFNRGTDIAPLPGMEPKDRLGVVVASERIAVRDNLPFSVRGGRLVVFGSGDLPTNNRILKGGNAEMVLKSIDWTVDRDTQLNIPARPIERFQLSLSADVFLKLRYALLFALPGLAATLGLIVYWTRRR
ncbi:MAG: GldG family protein [Verrucomicrobia bacterium]|nr:GldG family protein [Verrucomicrobiota bacterium]